MNITLLSQKTDYFERFSESFGRSQNANLFWIVLLAALGTLLLILFIKRVVQENFVDREGRYVFNELCRAHGLSRKERRLLLGYAQNLGLKNRVAVFVRPSLFEEAAQKNVRRGIAQKLNLNVEALGLLDAGLRTKLFGDYPLNGTLRRQADKVHQEQAQ